MASPFVEWLGRRKLLVTHRRYEETAVLSFKPEQSNTRASWSDADYDYLVSIHTEDFARSNVALAYMCTMRFGRDITENAIRGSLNRLRRAGRVPRYRPGHE